MARSALSAAWHSWTNDQGTAQNVYFVVSPTAASSTTFSFSWSVSTPATRYELMPSGTCPEGYQFIESSDLCNTTALAMQRNGGGGALVGVGLPVHRQEDWQCATEFVFFAPLTECPPTGTLVRLLIPQRTGHPPATDAQCSATSNPSWPQTSSPALADHGPSKTMDASTDTFFLVASGQSCPSFVTYDLGSVRSINGLQLGNGQSNYGVQAVNIQSASGLGGPWTTESSFTGTNAAHGGGVDYQMVDYARDITFDSQFVRLQITSNWGATDFAAGKIMEVRFYDCGPGTRPSAGVDGHLTSCSGSATSGSNVAWTNGQTNSYGLLDLYMPAVARPSPEAEPESNPSCACTGQVRYGGELRKLSFAF